MTTKWMPLMGTGLAVRMDMLDEAQAQRNHGQSLERLAERGGLGADEALAIAERRRWEKLREIEALKALALMGSNAKVTGSPALSASPCGLPGYASGGNGEQK